MNKPEGSGGEVESRKESELEELVEKLTSDMIGKSMDEVGESAKEIVDKLATYQKKLGELMKKAVALNDTRKTEIANRLIGLVAIQREKMEAALIAIQEAGTGDHFGIAVQLELESLQAE